VGHTTPNVGWGTDTVDAHDSVTQWWTTTAVRKGSYVTATLAWNRETSGNDAAGSSYAADLRDLDLYVRRFSDDSLVGRSESSRDSVEHIVAKMPERDRIKIEVKNRSAQTETFGIAWHSWATPTELRAFNGDFMGDRGALNDNGWFDVSTHGSSGTGKPDFMDQSLDESFAMKLTPDSLWHTAAMAQEVIRPTSGFWLQFDLAFTGNLSDATLSILLGNIDILGAAGYAGGIITPQPTNTNRYQRYTIDLSGNQNLFNTLTGDFHNLAFLGRGYGGGSIFVDNVMYVPTTGSTALLGLGLLAIARRRW
jgi:hypothetical protein